MPLFAKKLEGEGHEAARQFAEEAMAGLVFILLVITVVTEITMPFLMYGLAPGFSETPEKFDLAVLLTRITMPYLLCMSLVALMSGVLNTFGKFVESSSVSIVLNGVMMLATFVGMALGYQNEPMAGVIQAWGVFVAGILQLWLLMDGLRRNNIWLKLRWPRMTEGVRRLIALGIPGVIAGGVTQLNIVIGTVIASMQNGAVSYLYYADRLYELPLAIVGIAIGVVLLPDVSRHLRAENHEAVMDSQNRSLEFAMLLTLPAAVALAVVPTPIVSALFERGAFTAADTPATAYALAIFALGLPELRADQGVLARLLRARGHAYADDLRLDQPHRQYHRLDCALLPVPRLRAHAAPRHRGGDDARRLAQRRPALHDAGEASSLHCRQAAEALAAAHPSGDAHHVHRAVARRHSAWQPFRAAYP